MPNNLLETTLVHYIHLPNNTKINQSSNLYQRRYQIGYSKNFPILENRKDFTDRKYPSMEAGDPIIVLLFCKIRNSSPDHTAKNSKEGGRIRVVLSHLLKEESSRIRRDLFHR